MSPTPLRGMLLAATAAVCSSFGQTAPAPAPVAFIAADVHVSAPNGQRMLIGAFPQSDRYEMRGATMLQLISNAWGIGTDRIAGGPGWLALNRYDVIASFPAGSNQETLKSMLKALLADRFKLAVHNDIRPIQAFAMTVAKGGSKLKKSDGTGESGCKEPETNAAASQAGPSLINFVCHKMTMEEFAAWAPATAGGYFGGLSLVDQTKLDGAWDFTLKWSQRNQLDQPDSITFFAAAEKQLGLKIDPTKAPMPAIVVDSVNEKPTDNDPAAVKALAGPTEFELAVIKPSPPDARPQNGNPFLPGGRFELRGATLRELIQIAWEIQDDSKLVGAPSYIDKTSFDIVAKAPANGATTNLSVASIEVMIQSLLKDRFNLKVHNEERQGDAWALLAVKPKMAKADPSGRAECKSVASTANPARNRMVTCTNTTMAQFAAQIPNLAGGYFQGKPAFDSTGLEGAYDFKVNFSGIGIYQRMSTAASASGDQPSATDPTGAISAFEAIQQQLGLKIEAQKRPTTVLVVDHVDENPTNN